MWSHRIDCVSVDELSIPSKRKKNSWFIVELLLSMNRGSQVEWKIIV